MGFRLQEGSNFFSQCVYLRSKLCCYWNPLVDGNRGYCPVVSHITKHHLHGTRCYQVALLIPVSMLTPRSRIKWSPALTLLRSPGSHDSADPFPLLSLFHLFGVLLVDLWWGQGCWGLARHTGRAEEHCRELNVLMSHATALSFIQNKIMHFSYKKK